MLASSGLSAVKGKGGRKNGFYGQWVFLRESKIAFGNTVWFSFRWFSAANSVWM